MAGLNLWSMAGMAVLCGCAFFPRFRPNATKGRCVSSQEAWVGWEKGLLLAFFVLGVALRTYRWLEVPGGLNQDEASLGYDAFATAMAGMDRNGTHWPAYAVSWGSGQNVLAMYMVALLVRFFGLSVAVLRLPFLLSGIGALVVFPLLLRRLAGKPMALLGLFFLAVAPWHVVMSRWALESNLLPGMFLMGVYWLVLAMERRHTGLYVLAAATFSMAVYAYAIVAITMPLFLLVLCITLIRRRCMAWKQLLLCGAVFGILAAPLFVSMLVNMFHLPEVVTPFFSAPRMTAVRAELLTVPTKHNVRALLDLLWTQDDGFLWNGVPGYGICYVFMLPFVLLGIGRIFYQWKQQPVKRIMLLWLLCGLVQGCLIEVNINRLNILCFPYLYFLCEGVLFVASRIKHSLAVICAWVAVSAVLFASAYFGPEYDASVGRKFYRSFGEAVQAADALQVPVHVAADVNGAAILVMFYTQFPVQDFLDTVVYDDDASQFRMVTEFGRYHFSFDVDLDQRYPVYVINREKKADLPRDAYTFLDFEYFSVAVRK